MSKNSNGILAAVIGAIIGAMLTVIGTPIINNSFESNKIAGIAKEVSTTKISNLPQNVQEQIALVTTKYSLKHMTGKTGKGITISLSASEKISKNNFIIDKVSEPHEINSFDGLNYKINIPTFRPKSKFDIEVTHSPKTKIVWNEIIEEGLVIETDVPVSSKIWDIFWNAATLVILLACGFLILLFLLLKYLVNLVLLLDVDSGRNLEENEKRKFAWIIFSLWILSYLIKGVSSSNFFISFVEAFFGLLLYLLITNRRFLLKIIDYFDKNL